MCRLNCSMKLSTSQQTDFITEIHFKYNNKINDTHMYMNHIIYVKI